jgi:hypothetical protein
VCALNDGEVTGSGHDGAIKSREANGYNCFVLCQNYCLKDVDSEATSTTAGDFTHWSTIDVNDGNGGDYTWVKATYQAYDQGVTIVTHVDVKLVDDKTDYGNGTGDLASGAGGEYRYLVPIAGAGEPIVAFDLSSSNINGDKDKLSDGRQCSDNINNGRKTPVYACWYTRRP